ncbi:hypothetical protein SUGI_0135180 [Cryptomeria japonica]|nr:hypothetical protein SUGI_0135180 [Cryptomeria japonica]
MKNMGSLIQISGDAIAKQKFLSRTKSATKRVTVASIVMVAMIICAPIGINALREGSVPAQELEDAAGIESFFSLTHYPENCIASLSPYFTTSSRHATKKVLHIAIRVATKEANNAFVQASALFKQPNNRTIKMAVGDCVDCGAHRPYQRPS